MTISSFTGKYRFLSNFYEVPISWGYFTYPSVENAYQAAKTLDFADKLYITKLTSGQSKKFGKKVELRDDWESVKYNVMYQLNLQKFMNKDLKEMLISTGDEQLIEGNTWGDTYWGVYNGVGENKLGEILMSIRSFLKTDTIPCGLISPWQQDGYASKENWDFICNAVEKLISRDSYYTALEFSENPESKEK